MNSPPPVVVSLIGTSVNVSARFRRFCQTDPYTLAIVYDDQLVLPYIIDGKAGAVVPKGILLSVIHHGASLARAPDVSRRISPESR
jgi:hypothetical protein